MSSRPEAISQRVEAILRTVPAVEGRVWRDRDDAMTREESPAYLVEILDEDTRLLGGAAHPALPMHRVEESTLRIAVISCVRDAQWQTVADALRITAHALLIGDAELQALAPGLRRERCEWKPKSTDVPFGYAAQIYTCRYTNTAGSLTT